MQKGVIIVPSAGFDSLPSDLTTFLVANHFAAKGQTTGLVRYCLKDAKGGISGGTISSLNTMMKMKSSLLKQLMDPYCISEKGTGQITKDSQFSPFLEYHKDEKKWMSYFFMEQPNTRYVRRSASLLKYGPRFKYQEMLANSNLVFALISNIVSFLSLFLIWFSGIR